MIRLALAAALFLLVATPTLAEDLKPLCPDRPGLGTAPCTVDKGHLQLEVDAIDDTIELGAGQRVQTWANLAPALKYGLTDRVELQVSLSPYVVVRTRDSVSGLTSEAHGFGDVTLWTKVNMDRSDDAKISWAIQPFLKLPTAADRIGNGAVEGGVVVPVQIQLNDDWSLAFTSEADILKDATGNGRHLAVSEVVGLGRDFGKGLSGSAELQAVYEDDPDGAIRQYFFALSGAWQPSSDNNLQWDGGVNIGLNSQSPDVQVYAGITRRF